MRSYDATDEYDIIEAEKIGAKPWQLELLALNPSYTCWGPYEDYMCDKGGNWSSPIFEETWSDFGPWSLDDLNECVNFYFSIRRDNEECVRCNGNGYHRDAQQVVRTFYSHSCLPGETPWKDKITDDEVAALINHGRAKPHQTAEDINAENRPGVRGFLGHDAINRHILIEARLKRLGITVTCDHCGGSGYVYTAPEPTVSLTLWMLVPRKGCSRGVEIKSIEQHELPSIKEWLREAAQRNAQRFAAIAG